MGQLDVRMVYVLTVLKNDRDREPRIMQLGFFTMPIHPLDKDWRQSLREDREAFILADELGFTEGYVGEHTTDKAENITSCCMFIATLVSQTRQIRLGTGTVNLPNTHPARVAAEVAMLDHLLDGRFNFGISPGGLPSDAEVFAALDKDRSEMFIEAIDQILQIWKSDPPYNITGKYWTISTARTLFPEIGQGVLPKPLQLPHPPIVCTVTSPFSKSATQAGERGWLPLSANFLMPQWVRSHWQKYQEGCQHVGRVALPTDWRVAKSVFVADDATTARNYAIGPDSPYRFYCAQILMKMLKAGRSELFKRDRGQPDDSVTLDDVCEQLIIYGTPNQVADKILAFREQTGEFGTLVYAGHDWKDRDLARRSMTLIAEKVTPQINTVAGSQITVAS
jgi:alkanesulfonate monooxygenase SsuD/methylene tetrahydromethanopterin reductase-like flavin-dependent oxidoreductase (luciferase family)